jgi:HYR domain
MLKASRSAQEGPRPAATSTNGQAPVGRAGMGNGATAGSAEAATEHVARSHPVARELLETPGSLLNRTDNTYRGFETWTGTLSVPGLDFDVTAPILTGATNKTAKARKGAKSVRVTYNVTARDAVDGEIAAACLPTSGSRFKVGRTLVTCSASDTSANTGTAQFRVTARPAR